MTMRDDHQIVLAYMANGEWHTTLGLARSTHLPAAHVRAVLYNCRLARWVARGEVNPDPACHGARSWQITRAGMERLAKEKVRVSTNTSKGE